MDWMKQLQASRQLIWSVLIIAGFLLAGYIIVLMRPDVKKKTPEAKPTLVEIIDMEPKDLQVVITSYGTVQSEREVALQPEVSGRVIVTSPNLVVGGILRKNEMVLKIDPADYQLAVEQAEADLVKAEFDLKVELGRQIVAQREWELLSPEIKTSELGRELALREPHLKEKQAAVDSAKSRLEKAKLDLSRTVLRSPFNTVVTEENADIGQYLTPQATVAELVDTAEFRAVVNIPYDKLPLINIKKGTEVTVIQEIGRNKQITWEGKVDRLLGNVDPQGRLARVVVLIDDPLNLKSDPPFENPLLIGSYVSVKIKGPSYDNVYEIPRIALRDDSIVWVMTPKGKLEYRSVNVIYREVDTVIIDKGLNPGDKVVVSTIPLPVPGMKIRVNGENAEEP